VELLSRNEFEFRYNLLYGYDAFRYVWSILNSFSSYFSLVINLIFEVHSYVTIHASIYTSTYVRFHFVPSMQGNDVM
jgi:hypothetical protein